MISQSNRNNKLLLISVQTSYNKRYRYIAAYTHTTTTRVLHCLND